MGQHETVSTELDFRGCQRARYVRKKIRDVLEQFPRMAFRGFCNGLNSGAAGTAGMRANSCSPKMLANGFHERQIAAAVTTEHQELILLPTEKCNFRCTYCYEDFALGRMSERTQRAIELFLDKRVPRLRSLKFSWFGGEPLLAKAVVLRLATYAKALCDRQGVKFSGGLTTNAYDLNEELARKLIALNQNFFQITLDGWADAHDELRKRADGAGTFERIWNNLLTLKSLNLEFEVCMRVHVREDNERNLRTLMRAYAEHFFGDKRFYLDFQHLRDMGGEGGKSVKGVTRAELVQIEARLKQVVVDAVRGSLARSVTDSKDLTAPVPIEADMDFFLVKAQNAGESAGSQRQSEQPTDAPYICYASKANSLLIRSNGKLGKCTVAFNDDRNDIGYLADDGRVVVDQDKFRPWLHGLESLDVGDAGCPLHNLPSVPPGGRAVNVPVRVVAA